MSTCSSLTWLQSSFIRQPFTWWGGSSNEVHLVLRKLILQMCMRSHPMGLDVWFLVEPFVCFHTNSEGSGEPARMPVFAGRLCDKYHNLMGWLIYFLCHSAVSGATVPLWGDVHPWFPLWIKSCWWKRWALLILSAGKNVKQANCKYHL